MTICEKKCDSCLIDPCKNFIEHEKVQFDLTGLKPKENKLITLMFKYIQLGFYSSFLIIILGVISILGYWTVEPDPLTVAYADGESNWSDCVGRHYSFKRFVYTTKDVDIYVQERYYDLDGMADLHGIEGERVYPNDVRYQLGEGFKKIMTFKKDLPIDIPVGRYEYRPWARYKVNPIKEIYRPLPTQQINVHCDYDKSKHGEMK
jgi:hypothetical protein